MSNWQYLRKTLLQIYKIFFRLVAIIFKLLPVAISTCYQWLVKRLRFSITFKITTVYALIFALLLLLFNTGTIAATAAYLGWRATEDLKKDYQIVSTYLDENSDLPTSKLEQLAQLEQVELTLLAEDERVLYSTSEESPSPQAHENTWFHYDGHFSLSFNTPDHMGLALVFNDQLLWSGQSITLQFTQPLDKEALSLSLLAATLFSLSFIAIIIMLITGWRASKRMLKPVEVMTGTVKNISINALATRLDVSGSQDELKELAQTFNQMLDRIQFSYEQQNQFVSDASHELRTPIAVIQGYANLLDRWGKNDLSILNESIESIKSEAANMNDLVEKLLFLARGDKNTQPLEKKELALHELIEEVYKETKLIDLNHEITSQCSGNISVYADRKLMKEALRIFVDNSIKYTPEGGRININCYTQASRAVLTIEDTGIGIPKEDIPHIFNRFYRADKSRTKQTGGTGLGLAIAKWIILKHGGTIEVQSKVNEGTKISVFLPTLSA